MKLFIALELKSVYRLNNGELEYTPIDHKGTFDIDSFDYVEPELIGDELVTFEGQEIQFNEVYKKIKEVLSDTEGAK